MPLAILTLGLLLLPTVLMAAEGGIKRTGSGKPDLTGTYNAATLTPLTRPPEFGDNLYLTREEADKIASEQAARIDKANRNSDPDREAPAVGGAPVFGFEDTETGGNEFGAGNVGGYNWFWVDPGSDVFDINGKFRTSILTDPANGQMPPYTAEAQQKLMARAAGFRRSNDGTAWWLEREGPGPYDNPEQRPTAERCILGFTGYTPTLPSLYNNYKTIVQNEDHVMILIEMVHDARIVRMKGEGRTVEHPGPEVTKWLGDSIGWWEGDTLVVDTTNIDPRAGGFRGGSENTHVVERFTAEEDGDVVYSFTVEDDTIWTAPWSGEYIWKASDDRMFEYACHEGNYALGNVMRGARLLEEEAMAAKD